MTNPRDSSPRNDSGVFQVLRQGPRFYNERLQVAQLTFGHYEVLEPVGSGGMGVVYRARDTRLNRDVAIKVLRQDSAWTALSRDRLLREARAISALNHPNICTVHDIGDRDGDTFIVMEFVPGTQLTHRLARHGLDPETLVRLGIELADALEHAHQHGVIHRDLKPSNVVVTPSGRAKLVDFGVAAQSSIDPNEPTVQDGAVGQAIAGTLPYMAPEVIRGGIPDPRSDVWSLGVLLFECVSGERPFERPTAEGVTTAILRDSPAELPSDVPRGLAALIRRCLSKDPAARYQRAGEVRAALEAVQAQPASHGHGRTSRIRRTAAVAGLFLFALAVAGMTLTDRPASWLRGLSGSRMAAGASEGTRGLAVLPLVNLSGDAAQDFFADGMTAALITELAGIDSLKVISRTSIMRYRNRADRSIPEIGSELGVDAVLEGSVLRAGDRVRISVELVDVASDKHLWAESYEEPLQDVLTLQREISRAVADRVAARVSPRPTTQVRTDRVNPQAYELFLRGEISVAQGTPVGVERAIDYYREAVELDPEFAPAFAGLAGAVFAQEFWGTAPFGSTVEGVRELTEKALALDPNLADAHVMRGRLHLNYTWDWSAAETALKRAIELAPGQPWAYETYAWLLLGQGRRDEAIAAARTARSLDPKSSYMVFTEGRVLHRVRRYKEAESAYLAALSLDPGRPQAFAGLTQLYATQGRFAEAREIVARRDRLPSARPWSGPPAVLEALSGNTEAARQLALKLLPGEQARIHVVLGDYDAAFRALNQAVTDRSVLAPQWTDPDFDPLRADPRFARVVDRMGLPGERLAAWGRWKDTP
jgi:TolB-like protein/predicted Ser/Thr protein kinase